MEDAAGSVEAVEEAILGAAKYDGRSEPLTELVAVARTLIEQARAAEAERAKVAAEEAAAAAAVKAAAEAERAKVAAEAAATAAAVKAAAEAVKRQQLVAELAALDLRTKQVQPELGSWSGTPQPDGEETQCVVFRRAQGPHHHAVRSPVRVRSS
jgi:colicin import membrane protein